ILIDHGNQNYVDETAARVAAADRSGGIAGQATRTPWGKFINVLDFNRDGAPDFVVAPWFGGSSPSSSRPVVWLNDGSGHFTTLKAGDLVDSGHAYLIDFTVQPFQTGQGMGFVRTSSFGGKLSVDVIAATSPYPATAAVLTEGAVPVTRTGGAAADTLAGGGGNDTFSGGAGNDKLDGGAGLDTALFGGNRAAHVVNKTASGFTISGPDGSDTLSSIERVQFADAKLALDLTGNAGKVARILGAVFGPTAVSNKVYVGIGLQYLDGGMSYEALTALAVGAAGASTSRQIVNLLWTNLMGSAPTTQEAQPYVDLLNGGMTAGELGVLAADAARNQENIKLAGLADTGLEYA
ncbi:MAG: hypothetical protein ACK4N4_11230, partial [Burkholderiales bacterium]